MKIIDIYDKKLVLSLDAIKTDSQLIANLQVKFVYLNLYPNIRVDGLYGPRTQEALLQFCESVHLNSFRTNKFGSTFAKALIETKPQDIIQKFSPNKLLTAKDILTTANYLNCNIAHIKAILDVEASGRGFLPNGKVKILFERHLFYKCVNGNCKGQADICRSGMGGWLGGNAEWVRLTRASKINHDCAIESASWGLGQVLGQNYKVCGYDNAHQMVLDFSRSEGLQLLGVAHFIKGNGLDSALRNNRWNVFARGYNGPAYKKMQYDTKLKTAFGYHLANPTYA